MISRSFLPAFGSLAETAASIPGALTIRVRTSKTNRDGEATDIRLVKNGAAAALTALRPDNASPGSNLGPHTLDELAAFLLALEEDDQEEGRGRLVKSATTGTTTSPDPGPIPPPVVAIAFPAPMIT